MLLGQFIDRYFFYRCNGRRLGFRAGGRVWFDLVLGVNPGDELVEKIRRALPDLTLGPAQADSQDDEPIPLANLADLLALEPTSPTVLNGR